MNLEKELTIEDIEKLSEKAVSWKKKSDYKKTDEYYYYGEINNDLGITIQKRKWEEEMGGRMYHSDIYFLKILYKIECIFHLQEGSLGGGRECKILSRIYNEAKNLCEPQELNKKEAIEKIKKLIGK